MSVEAVMDNKPKGLEQKWKVLISVMFGIFMIILDSTVVNIAFPTLRREFGASLADAQWVLSIYVLSLGVTTPVSGYLADRFGIKRMYLLGISLFVVGSLLCGLAPTLGWLIVARAIQGFGGGISQPLGTRTTLPCLSSQRAGDCAWIFWYCPGVCACSWSDPRRLAGGCESLAFDLLYQHPDRYSWRVSGFALSA